jgi:tetratricopeptide (TPR) repeat protein
MGRNAPEDGMKKLLIMATLAMFVVALLGASPDDPLAGMQKPRYTADKKLMRPTGYREWVFLSSGLGMNYAAGGPSGANQFPPQFTNVFVQPEAYRQFKRTGHWPDKTIFALEIYSPATHGSINKQGHFQDSFSGLEAEVKDSTLDGGWAYYGFGTDGQTADANPKEGCFNCHENNAAVEHSFVQFYPDLLETALKLNTINPGINIPLNRTRLFQLAKDKGWPTAEKTFEEARAKDPDADIFQNVEANLNAIGYGLMSAGKNSDAVAVLKRVANDHPNSVNAFDSLADAYDATGDKQNAIEASQRELELAKASTLPDRQKEQFIKLATDRIAKLQASAK